MKCRACSAEMQDRPGELHSDHVVTGVTSTHWECPRCGSFCVLVAEGEHAGRVLAAGWLMRGTKWPD